MARSKVNPFLGSPESQIPQTTIIENEGLPVGSSTPPATAAVPVEFMTQLLAMFAEKMNEGLSKVLTAARTVPIDPIKERQKERALAQKMETEAAFWAQLKSRFAQCNHLREDLTCCICWATQSDGKARGYCPHCHTVFSPVRSECASQEIFSAYKDLIRIPTSKGNAVVYI